MKMHARHHHVCPCGAVLYCADADRCPVRGDWLCGACELDQHDAAITLNEQQQEHTHGH